LTDVGLQKGIRDLSLVIRFFHSYPSRKWEEKGRQRDKLKNESGRINKLKTAFS